MISQAQIDTLLAQPGKEWADMTRNERVIAMEIIMREISKLALAISTEFSDILKQAGAPFAVELMAHLVVDPNNDPRLL